MAYRGGRARERVLAFGPMGAGKSTAARTLYDVLGAEDVLHVIDCDNRWAGMLDNHPEIEVWEEWDGKKKVDEGEGRLVLYHVRDWEQFLWAFEHAMGRANRDDWLVVDSMTWPWGWLQRWYIRKTHGEDMPEFLLDYRMREISEGRVSAKDKADGGQSATLIEWNFINPLWLSKVAEPIVNAPCHLFLIAEGKQIRSDGRERRDVVDVFGEFGYKPESQWRLGFQMRSVVLFTKSARQQFFMDNSVKDDEREVAKVEWEDFARDYLVKVAGWKPKKVEVSGDGE
jgi:hypothetical protein